MTDARNEVIQDDQRGEYIPGRINEKKSPIMLINIIFVIQYLYTVLPTDESIRRSYIVSVQTWTIAATDPETGEHLCLDTAHYI